MLKYPFHFHAPPPRLLESRWVRQQIRAGHVINFFNIACLK
jgi:hypothetical protein